MTRKQKFILRVMHLLFLLGNIVREIKDLINVFNDRGYGAGETAITQEDLDTVMLDGSGMGISGGTPLGMTLAEFLSVAGLLVQLSSWADGQPVTPADNEAIINRFRTDV